MDTSPNRRLVFVCSGMGRCGGEAYTRHSAVRLEPGESILFEAEDDTELFVISLPMIGAAERLAASQAAE